MKLLFSLLFTVFLSFPTTIEVPKHEFHLSRTRVEYAAAEQEWQISIHIFIDDLALALEERGAPDLLLGTRSESSEADAYIEKYLKTCLQFEAEASLLSWEWLGKETSEDLSAFHIYLFVPNAQPNAPLKVKNQLLIDLYDDQQNMLQFIGVDKATRQLLFHRDYWEAELNNSRK